MSAPFPGWHACLLLVPLTSTIYDLIAGAALRRWMKEPVQRSDGAVEPLTCFHPLKAGVPHLREKLEMLLQGTSAQDQIILGVEAGTQEETIGEAVRRAFPERDVTVVRCEPARAVSPKISKLVQMAPLARNACWLLSDSEVIFQPGFLEALREEWQLHDVAALTTGYRFVNLASWPQRCDALGVLLGLWPGLALVRRYGRLTFTLGACTLFRRDALAALGGWAAFGQQLAEDQRLGEALVKGGGSIRLSRQITTLACDPLSWRDYWRHQRRVAVTYRAANPAGFAGVLLTFGPVWSVLCLAAFRESWWLLAALVTVGFRYWRVWRASQFLTFRVPGMAVAFWITSFVEVICWALSWFSSRVWWSGRWWHVGFRGELSPEE